MNAEEIKRVDIVYRSYYKAYQEAKMIGVYDVARENNLSNEEVNKVILFLEGEKQIEINNKGFDPINSGAVYSLTKKGYAWFAKTCYENELLKKPAISNNSITNNIYGGNNQIGDQNSQTINSDKKENFIVKYSMAIIITVIATVIAAIVIQYLNLA